MARYTVNASILLTQLPLLQRPAAVRAAGFEAVEFWWPFARAVPSDTEVTAFVGAISDAGVALTGLNLYAGDMAAGERGVLSQPSRSTEFRAHLDVVAAIVEQTGCGGCNALYGIATPASDDELAVEQLAQAASVLSPLGATVMLEPLSGVADYPLRTAADVDAVINRVRDAGQSVALLADLYHLAVNGDDVDTVISREASRFGHVQIADAPGRGQPGSGELPLRRWVSDCAVAGYRGWIGLEYATDDPDPFAWLPVDERRTA